MATTISLPFPFAGAKLGLSVKDLAEKYGLTDDQAEGIYTEFGQAELPKMTETLGYQVGGLPTRTETIFENFAPAYKPLEAGETTEEVPQEEAAKRLLSSYIGEKGIEGIVEGIKFGEDASSYLGNASRVSAPAPAQAKYSGNELQKAIAESERKAVTEREGFGEYDSGYLGSGVSGAQRSADTGRLFINLDNVLYPELVQNKTRSIEQIGKYSGYDQFTKLTGSISKAELEQAAARLNISPEEAAKKAQAQGTLTPWTAPRSSSPSDITSHINVGGQASEGYMGKAAVDRAKAAGLSSAEIQRQAAAKGLKFGSDVSF